MRNSHSLILSFVLVAAMAASTGCIKSNLQVRVNPDGSGEIMLSRMFARDIVATRDQKLHSSGQSEDMPDEMNMSNDPFFTEKQLARLGHNFGDNVSLVRVQKLNYTADRGYCVLYSFKNVNDLCINPWKFMDEGFLDFSPGMDKDEDNDAPWKNPEEANKSIQFKFTKGAPNKLRIIMPPLELKNEDPVSDIQDDTDDKANQNEEKDPFVGVARNFGWKRDANERTYSDFAIRMIERKRRAANMTLSLEIEVAGALVTSTASHPDTNVNNRITLLSLDSNKLMSSPKISSKIYAELINNRRAPWRFLKTAGGQPGFICETKPEIELQFQ